MNCESSQSLFSWKAYWDEKASESNPVIASGRSGVTTEQFAAIVADVRNKLELRAEDTLLDIGCGSGLLLKCLSPAVKGAVGVDFSPAMLSVARSETAGLPNVELRLGEMAQLPIRGAAFSRILCYSALHYLASAKEVAGFLREIRRCGKKGGIALLGDLPREAEREAYLNGIWKTPFPEEQKHLMFERNSRALWFSPDALIGMIDSLGMTGTVLVQNESLPYARLTGRFDICVAL